MDRLEDCISYLVSKAAQQVSRRARDRLAPFAVTPTQYAVLKVLWDRDGQNGAELGARLQIDSATVTGVIDRLAASGLLERRADGDDRRVQRLFLTARGRALNAPLDAAMDDLNAEMRGLLGGEAPAVWSALRRLGDPRA
jgi:DNA-binding MarR family transcriptional regulator